MATKTHLLIVDDERPVLRALERVFLREGYAVTSVTSGALALEAMVRQKQDAVLSDIMMPEMDGIELLAAIRERDLDLPVLLQTGNPSPDKEHRAIQAGAFRYMAKPPDLVELKESVRKACRLHRFARAKRQAQGILGGADRGFGDHAATDAAYARAQSTLRVALQPMVDVDKNEIVGYEALLRTQEPAIENPRVLLHMAERLGRTRELGRAVRGAVVDVFADIPPSATVFVNLHPSDLDDEALFAKDGPFAEVADRVVLEVSDEVLLSDRVEGLARRVAELRGLGFRVALDHVGSGSAGVENLAAVEPNYVKIDVALVADVGEAEEKQEIIRQISSINEELGIETIAVGVERAADRDALACLGCTLQQGYLFGMPA